MGCHSLLHGLFQTQGLNSGLLHCRQILFSSVQFSSVTQSCPTLCDPVDCSLPGFSVHGTLQARLLEWVGGHALLQEILLIQPLNLLLLCLLCWQAVLHHERHLGSPIICTVLYYHCHNQDKELSHHHE